MTTYDILERLDNVKQKNESQWVANCPACNDTNQHLYIKKAEGKTLLYCFHGCAFEEIIEAIGVESRDMYVESVNQQNKPEKTDNTPLLFLRKHIYHDINGNVIAEKLVYRKSDGGKTATWQRYENGRFIKGLKDIKMPLYHLTSLTSADTVFIVEGEKDVETMEAMGYTATSAPNGAGNNKWKKEYNEYLKGKTCIIIADNDKPGKELGVQTAESLAGSGIAVKLLNATDIYKEVQEKGDISDIVAIVGFETAKELLKQVIEKIPDYVPEFGSWFENLKRDYKGKVKNTLENIYTILCNDSKYKSRIKYNELTQMRIYDGINWTDVVESRLKLYLEKKYGIVSSLENINHACSVIADDHSFHPIRDYLDAVEWDGVPRIKSVFSDFFGADDNIYTQSVAIVSFVGAVARTFSPGIKFDTCTVLVGKQGVGKSKFIGKIAVKPEWFTDGVVSFDGKDFYESIQGKWIVELGEGTAFQKSIKERSKQAITSQCDFYRRPYGRNPEERPRQCVFWGTTNSYDFLKDETGDRRYYPIDIDMLKATKSIDNDLTDEYIEQLWAEAVQLYRNGQSIYIQDRNIIAMAEQEQKKHLDENPLQSDIYNFLEIPITSEWNNISLNARREYIKAYQRGQDCIGTHRRDRISVKEIACELFGYELNQPIDRRFSLDVVRTLTALGWNKSGKAERVNPYGVIKVFYK